MEETDLGLLRTFDRPSSLSSDAACTTAILEYFLQRPPPSLPFLRPKPITIAPTTTRKNTLDRALALLGSNRMSTPPTPAHPVQNASKPAPKKPRGCPPKDATTTPAPRAKTTRTYVKKHAPNPDATTAETTPTYSMYSLLDVDVHLNDNMPP